MSERLFWKQDEGKDFALTELVKGMDLLSAVQHGNGQSWVTGSLSCPSHVRIYSNKESSALASDTKSACTI